MLLGTSDFLDQLSMYFLEDKVCCILVWSIQNTIWNLFLGDAALFGINGFNMLLDGGYSRKACFWDFVRHLDRLDAVLMTRLNNSNVGGISSVLRRKRQDAVYPQIGHFFCNIQVWMSKLTIMLCFNKLSHFICDRKNKETSYLQGITWISVSVLGAMYK